MDDALEHLNQLSFCTAVVRFFFSYYRQWRNRRWFLDLINLRVIFTVTYAKSVCRIRSILLCCFFLFFFISSRFLSYIQRQFLSGFSSNICHPRLLIVRITKCFPKFFNRRRNIKFVFIQLMFHCAGWFWILIVVFRPVVSIIYRVNNPNDSVYRVVLNLIIAVDYLLCQK